MYAVRAGIRDIGKESSGQLALNVEIPLLYVSVFRITVAANAIIGSQRGAAVCEPRSSICLGLPVR